MKARKYKRLLLGIIGLSLLAGLILANLGRQVTNDLQIRLYKHQQKEVVEMNLEEYIKGTVAAEMPASFEMEALKAQAICARTYAVKKLLQEPAFPLGAELSDDVASCQAFVSQNEFASLHNNYQKLWERVDQAVESTRGEVILYNSEPIDALYCSTCGGYTEDPLEVWGGSVPYLKSVECGYCKQSGHYINEQLVGNQVLKKLVDSKSKNLSIKIEGRTLGGRPKEVNINGKTVKAIEIRSKLGLSSSWIEFQTNKNDTLIRTRGYGHGVGLCQYGADGMARTGKNYQQILKHYYQGISLYKLGY